MPNVALGETSCTRVSCNKGLQTKLLMKIILQDDSMFINRFEVLNKSCAISRESVDTPLNYAKKYYSQIYLYLQGKCMCIHNSCFSAFSLMDLVTNIVL